MSDDLDFTVIDDIPEYTFCIPDDEELENVIPIKGEDGSFKYEKVAELPETGEDGVLYLVPKPHETQTASGNPISINVTEGAGKLSDLKLDGNATQTTYSGKNLLQPHAYPQQTLNGLSIEIKEDGSVVVSGTATTNTSFRVSEPLDLQVGETYTLSGCPSGGSSTTWQLYTNQIAPQFIDYGAGATKTITSGTGAVYFIVRAGATIDTTFYPQLEKGSTATAYEPYVGGTASPNPDYPQDINVVTGTQTIDINGTSYPINLGNIELAEIGTYRDYIHKVGNEWKVHKAIGKITWDGSEANWYYYVLGSSGMTQCYRDLSGVAHNSSEVRTMSDYFTGGVLDDRYRYANLVYTTNAGIAFNPYTADFADISAFKTWLSTHNTTVYYALATATDTTITDTTLIAQLEAARNAALANGTNVINNTATGNNLAGDLELSYYEYDPTNKYNKWLWLDDDAAYEQM